MYYLLEIESTKKRVEFDVLLWVIDVREYAEPGFPSDQIVMCCDVPEEIAGYALVRRQQVAVFETKVSFEIEGRGQRPVENVTFRLRDSRQFWELLGKAGWCRVQHAEHADEDSTR